MTVVDHASQLVRNGRAAEAVAKLESAVDAGDSPSAIELGIWFLEGRYVPRDLRRSRAAFARAAEIGDVTAERIYTSFVALGIGATADWTGALERLEKLARRDALAAAQLSLLDCMELTATGDPVGRPVGRRLSDQPEIASFDNLFTVDECSYLISRAEPLLRPSVIVDPSTGVMKPHPIRTSDGAMFPWVSEDLVIHALNRRIAKASDTQVDCGEPLQVLRYRPGQEYRPHLDALPKTDNQRVLTMLVYLNDDYRGGETCFTRTGLKFTGDVGTGLLFRNASAGGLPDENALHAGEPVAKGQKFLASRWIRELPIVPS